ncbi:hypothetical protein [Pseudarthrobacter sp. S9]|uniref:hypothetical protein n=1 Tax=Pseudarthrobacter sp. S9 TaxID=3418421 RepID=UPI003CFC297D
MLPATNSPHLPSSTAVHALKSARPVSPAVHHGAASQHPGRGRRDTHHATLGGTDYVASPYCERCGTDEFIYLETFVPATQRRDGSVSKLGEVTYFCSGCDDFSAHAVPASWVPPGWYFG